MPQQQRQPTGWDSNGKPLYDDAPQSNQQPVGWDATGKPIYQTGDHRPGWLKFIAPDGPVAQVGRGVSQSVMSSLIPVADLVNRGASAIGLNDRIRPEVFSAASREFATSKTPLEAIGNAAGEVGQFAIPVAQAAKGTTAAFRGANAIKNLAVAFEKRAVPELSELGARMVLDRGQGIVTKGAAKALGAEARATRRPGITAAAQAMKDAANKPMSLPTWQEAAVLLGTGAWNPRVAALVGGAHLLTRPLPASLIAQGMYSAAPNVVGAMAGGASLGIAEYLKSLFGGGSE